MKTWNLNQELVTKEEIKENLENLKDTSENAEPMVLFSDSPDITTDQQPSQTTSETQASQIQASQMQTPQIQTSQRQQAPQIPQTQKEQTLSKIHDTAYNTPTYSATSN